MPPAARVRLIVNADDFGAQPERDAAILALHAAGAVSSASLLVNGGNADAAVRAARVQGLPLGLHLNLGDGPALAGRSALTDARGHFLGKAGLRAALDRDAPPAALGAEIAAQLDHFGQLAGQPPTHLDGHHHCHVAPAVAAALLTCLAHRPQPRPALRLPRLTPGLESLDEVAERFAADPDTLAFHRRVQAEAAAAASSFAAARLRRPDGFFGIALMGRGMTAAALRSRLDRLRALPPGIYELMCHPGTPAGDDDDFASSPEREQESAALREVFAAPCDDLALTDFTELPPCPS